MNRTSSSHIRFLAGAALAAAASTHYVRADLDLTEERICGTCSVHHFASLCYLSTASYSCPDQSFDYCSGSCTQPCPIIYNSGAPPVLKAYVERWTGGHMQSGSRAVIAPIGLVNASAPVCTYTSHQYVDGGGGSGSFTGAGINLTVRFQPVPAVYWAARVHIQAFAIPTPQVGGGGYYLWALGGPSGPIANQTGDPQVCTFYGTATNVSELAFSFSGEASRAAQCCGGAFAVAVLQTRVQFFIDSAPFTLPDGDPMTTGCTPDLTTTDLNSNGIIDANESASFATSIASIDESVARNSSGGASSGTPSCLSHGFRQIDDLTVTIPAGDVGKAVTELVFYTAETLGGPDGEFQWNGTVNVALYRDDGSGYPIGEGGDGCNPWLEWDAADSADAVVTRTFLQPLPNDYYFTDGGCKRYLPGQAAVFEYRITNHPGGLFTIPATQTETTMWWIGMRPVTDSLTTGFSGWYSAWGGGSNLKPYLRPNPNPGSGEPQICDFQERLNVPGSYGDLAFSVLFGNDVDLNGLPDDLQPDCNANGTYDFLDIVVGSSDDANANGIPDECDPPPCTGTRDCNSNGLPDDCDIAGGTAADCNSNGIPDSCDIDAGTSADCNSNATPDACDIAGGTSQDANTNGTPDECEPGDGDADGDGDVDLNDYQIFAAVMAGPGADVPPEGDELDLDGDGDVDLADYGGFQRVFDSPRPCCRSNGTCDMATPPDCFNQGGTPSLTSPDCGAAQCPAAEACCLSASTCDDLTVAACADAKGDSRGPGTTCASIPPCDSRACCYPNGFCDYEDFEECLFQGGTPQGVGSTCATANCPPAEACCLPNGSCADLTTNGCAGQGGAAQLPGTSCATVSCPQPTGACCGAQADGACANEQTPTQCSNAGGTYRGNNSTCPPPGLGGIDEPIYPAVACEAFSRPMFDWVNDPLCMSPITWSLSQVTDPNGLPRTPAGMTIDSSTGVLSWLYPTLNDLGVWRVTVRAANPFGFDELDAFLSVGYGDAARPRVNDVPDGAVDCGTPYTGPTPVLTNDCMNPVTWSLVTGPAGMTIDPSTGVVTWSNPVLAGSPFTITIRATNAAGSVDETWELTVNAPCP